MRIFNTAERYGPVVQFMHWATVILVVCGWLLGTFGDDLPRGAVRNAGLFIHMSAGLLVLGILVLRLLWRVIDTPPAPEKTPLGPRLDHAGRLAHVILYALLVAVPLAGIAAQFARGRPIPMFGIGQIASPWVADRAFAHSVTEVHELLANALMAVAALHAAAALAHHYLFRDRTLARMLPGTRS